MFFIIFASFLEKWANSNPGYSGLALTFSAAFFCYVKEGSVPLGEPVHSFCKAGSVLIDSCRVVMWGYCDAHGQDQIYVNGEV